MTALQYSERS